VQYDEHMPQELPYVLAVVGVRTQTAHHLPASGTITIGRGDDCDVVIDDASVSRRHAELALGPQVTICDLGSSNGTRVRRNKAGALETEELFDIELESGVKVPLAVGEPIAIGSVLAFLRHDQVAREAAAKPERERVVVAPETVKAMELAKRIARGPVAVLITGETGVGKEVFAHAVHESSPRAAGPFVTIHCGALPDALAESELFGHERGAFTGATAAKAGLFETADGGTIFLDEVAELSPAMQTKLLRVVEDKKVLRLGATAPRTVDVRVVSATNRNLQELVKSGGFRQDLYFRLNGITIHVPPLRARKVEIAPLARLFATQTAWAMGEPTPRLRPDVIALLEARDWPGNARELRNVIERAVVLATGAAIEPAHLLLEDAFAPQATAASASLQGELADLEKQRIVDALARSAGNQTKAALLLGMPRRTLITRLTEYGIERPRKR
jgi:two-component system, NtrC family, response regulator AtoC